MVQRKTSRGRALRPNIDESMEMKLSELVHQYERLLPSPDERDLLTAARSLLLGKKELIDEQIEAIGDQVWPVVKKTLRRGLGDSQGRVHPEGVVVVAKSLAHLLARALMRTLDGQLARDEIVYAVSRDPRDVLSLQKAAPEYTDAIVLFLQGALIDAQAKELLDLSDRLKNAHDAAFEDVAAFMKRERLPARMMIFTDARVESAAELYKRLAESLPAFELFRAALMKKINGVVGESVVRANRSAVYAIPERKAYPITTELDAYHATQRLKQGRVKSEDEARRIISAIKREHHDVWAEYLKDYPVSRIMRSKRKGLTSRHRA